MVVGAYASTTTPYRFEGGGQVDTRTNHKAAALSAKSGTNEGPVACLME